VPNRFRKPSNARRPRRPRPQRPRSRRPRPHSLLLQSLALLPITYYSLSHSYQTQSLTTIANFFVHHLLSLSLSCKTPSLFRMTHTKTLSQDKLILWHNTIPLSHSTYRFIFLATLYCRTLSLPLPISKHKVSLSHDPENTGEVLLYSWPVANLINNLRL